MLIRKILKIMGFTSEQIAEYVKVGNSLSIIATPQTDGSTHYYFNVIKTEYSDVLKQPVRTR